MINQHKKSDPRQASFCLEDNRCQGVEPRYDCENYGEQGITAGCQDIYYNNIDCQWIDITDLEVGNNIVISFGNYIIFINFAAQKNSIFYFILFYSELYSNAR